MKHISPKIILPSVILLAAAGAGAYYYLANNHQYDDNSTELTSRTTVEDRPVGEIDLSKPKEEERNPAIDSSPTSPRPLQESQGESIPTLITYAGGSPLQVRVLINEILPSGTCTLTLEKPGSKSVIQTAEVFPTSSSSTCKGFTVDASSLDGTYKVTVTVTYNNRTGSAVREISL